jgi:Meiotically up-regulated gene 113
VNPSNNPPGSSSAGGANDSEPYPYKGLPLTPGIMEWLIPKIFSGQTVERKVIAARVQEFHRSQGGKAAKAQDLGRSVKRALEKMRDKGLAEQPGYAHWRIPSDDVPSPSDTVSSTEEPAVQSTDVVEFEPVAERVLGSGDHAVYLYYFPTYRLFAESRGEKRWPCKIGLTESDPLSRILSQAATAMSEKPVIALLIRTPNSRKLERTLHDVLDLRNQRLEKSPGAEWFDTSPDEVLKLLQAFDVNLAEQVGS